MAASVKEIYYFTAPWCKSCANLKPHIDKVQGQGITVHEINVDDQPETAQEYDVMQLPTLVFLEDGTITNRKAGFSENMVFELNSFMKS